MLLECGSRPVISLEPLYRLPIGFEPPSLESCFESDWKGQGASGYRGPAVDGRTSGNCLDVNNDGLPLVVWIVGLSAHVGGIVLEVTVRRFGESCLIPARICAVYADIVLHSLRTAREYHLRGDSDLIRIRGLWSTQAKSVSGLTGVYNGSVIVIIVI
jgi:hypothetical protein